MKSNNIFYSELRRKLGLTLFDAETMYKDFIVCTDYHPLLAKDIDTVYAAANEAFRMDARRIVNQALIECWLFDIKESDQCKWGVYNKDGTYVFMPHNDVEYGVTSVMYYRYQGTPADPSNMFHLVKDWVYMKQLWEVFKAINIVDNSISQLFAVKTNESFEEIVEVIDCVLWKCSCLKKLFTQKLTSTEDFIQWCYTTFAMDCTEVTAMIDAGANDVQSELYSKINCYLELKETEYCNAHKLG